MNLWVLQYMGNFLSSTEQLCCFELVSLLTVASGNSKETGSVLCILTCAGCLQQPLGQ